MLVWLQAGLWGGLVGGALLLGAVVGYWIQFPRRIIAGVMAFGSGVLISALSFELMAEAYHHAGFVPTAIGFLAGALIYSGANGLLSRWGAKHRKRSSQQPSADEAEGSGAAIAVVAIFISNIPEGLSSSAGMRASGRSALFVFGLWFVIALASGLVALAGYSVFGDVPVTIQGATTALAAGGILAMLAETMIPEAFEGTHDWAGIIACAGFLCAFALSMLGELRSAAVVIDRSAMGGLVERIEIDVPNTAKALQKLVDNLQFGRIQNLLRDIK